MKMDWKLFIGFLCFGIAAVVGSVRNSETSVNTPYDEEKMVIKNGLDIPERYWGSYRANLYFGFKPRDPYSLVTGLMWYFPKRLSSGGDGIRHWCERSDGLEKYGWIQHDGTNFGVQEIHDDPFVLNTSFVKRLGGIHGGDWTARITVDLKPGSEITEGEEVSLIWYTALDEEQEDLEKRGSIKPITESFLTGFRGESPGLGEFTIKLFNSTGSVQHASYLSTVAAGLDVLPETIISSLTPLQGQLVLPGESLPIINGSKAQPNFIATQVTIKVPFALDVVFESGSFGTRPNTVVGPIYSDALAEYQSRFEQRFEDTFHLKEKGYGAREINFAQAGLSNMVGGISYFYGASRVQSNYTKEPVPYWKAPLYTAVPSRSVFPRGFLWDEGFHGLLISAWDVDIELDIICHWFDLMNIEGWIPREQILGKEALGKIADEYVTQQNVNANPPIFLMTLTYILDNVKDELTEERLAVIERLYPRLEAWFTWFNTTQTGSEPGTYRWRGRNDTTNLQLNPQTLTSGLDDYPRASHPTDDERHIDLRCWIALASNILGDIATVLGKNGDKYYQTSEYLSNNELMDKLHWSEDAGLYADYGYHTDAVELVWVNGTLVRVTSETPENRLVDTTFGYVSLFPFLVRLLEPDSPKLNKTLTDLRNPDLLWTNFGLRSLSKTSPLYMKYNTELEAPYWRGQIWINFNYMAVLALNHYSITEGPYQQHAKQIYEELRGNIIRNMMAQYYETGYIWEQFIDETGAGSGSQAFTGWSALFVLLMGEEF